MRVNRSYSVRQALVLDADDIRALDQALTPLLPNFACSAKCKDGTRSFDTLADLIAYENVKPAALQALQFEWSSTAPPRRLDLEIGSPVVGTASVRIGGTEADVAQVDKEVTVRLHEMKPWWSLLSRGDYLFILSGVLIALILGMSIAVTAGWYQLSGAPGTAKTYKDVARDNMFSAVFYGGLFVGGLALNAFRNRVFPRVVFAIGRGKRRYQDLEKLQWGVVITVVLGLLVNWFTQVISFS